METQQQDPLSRDIDFLLTSDHYLRVIKAAHDRREQIIGQIYTVRGDTQNLHELVGELRAANDILYGLGYSKAKDIMRFRQLGAVS